MAALVQGRDYPLSSHSFSNSNKSAFHVKLTDSALRAIEEFQKLKVCMLQIGLKIEHLVLKVSCTTYGQLILQ